MEDEYHAACLAELLGNPASSCKSQSINTSTNTLPRSPLLRQTTGLLLTFSLASSLGPARQMQSRLDSISMDCRSVRAGVGPTLTTVASSRYVAARKKYHELTGKAYVEKDGGRAKPRTQEALTPWQNQDQDSTCRAGCLPAWRLLPALGDQDSMSHIE